MPMRSCRDALVGVATHWPVLGLLVTLLLVPRELAAVELYGWVSGEGRLFPNSAANPGQEEQDASFVLRPEFYQPIAGGNQSITFIPFLRLDAADPERTHADIRDLTWIGAFRDFEVRVGIQKQFWGVTESKHLVDILNQTDLVENVDGEDKLGQPMLDVTFLHDWGVFDLFVMSGFRERTFPGRKGRLRTEPRVDPDQVTYESGAKRGHVDWAARWAHTLGPWDWGLSYFDGTGRDPLFTPASDSAGDLVLAPHYVQIQQGSIDAQFTIGGWLWKLEAIYRSGFGSAEYWEAVGGFEYTWGTVFGTNLDVGLLTELHRHEFVSDSIAFDEDVFVGSRIAFNDVQDTQILGGALVDRNSGAVLSSIEASRRIGDRWRLEAEFRGFFDIPEADPRYGLRDDSYIQIDLARYF